MRLGHDIQFRRTKRFHICCTSSLDVVVGDMCMGLQVIMDLLVCRAYGTGHPYCEELSIWNEQEWGEYISTLSTHDNLVAWYLPDEIDDYAVAADLYGWVKEYDPHQRPVYGNPGTFDLEIIQRFPDFSD